jgi:hypothetical protein
MALPWVVIVSSRTRIGENIVGRDRDEYEIGDVGERQTKHQSGGRATLSLPSGLSMWKPKKSGSHTIDIIPFRVTDNHLKYPKETLQFTRPGKWWFERTFYAHRGIGVNSESYTCLAKTFGKACPICEARIRLNQSPHKDDEEKAMDLKPKDRQLFLIYDNDDIDRGVQLWEEANWNFGQHLDKYVEGARKQDKDAYRRFFHPLDGFTIRLTATEKAIGGGKGGKPGNNTEYTVHQFYKRDRDLPSSLFEHGYDLDAMIRELDYDSLKKIFTGASVDEADPETNGKARSRRDEEPRRDRDELDDRNERHDRERDRDRTRDDRGHREERSRDDDPPPRSRRDEPADTKSDRKEERRDDPPPKSKDKVDFGSKDIVKFNFKGEVIEGEIEKVDLDKKIAFVIVEGRERPSIQDFEDLTMVKAFDGFDSKSKEKERARDEDDGRSFDRNRSASREDDDNPPPRRR